MIGGGAVVHPPTAESFARAALPALHKYGVVLCCVVSCYAALCCVVLCRAVLCCAVLYRSTVLCSAVPCRALLFCSVKCSAALCYRMILQVLCFSAFSLNKAHAAFLACLQVGGDRARAVSLAAPSGNSKAAAKAAAKAAELERLRARRQSRYVVRANAGAVSGPMQGQSMGEGQRSGQVWERKKVGRKMEVYERSRANYCRD